MGLYYNSPNPNIGRQQPLEPVKLDPPQSGPTPQNPPFRGAAAMALGAVLIAAWAPPPPGPNMGNAQPYAQEVLSPPISAPQNPPFNGGARVSREILIDWIPPPPDPFMGRAQPLDARKLVPPQSAPSMIPVGARVPQAMLVWWVPPAPGPYLDTNTQPYAPPLLTPPQSGPTPQNPPFMGGAKVGQDVLINWIPGPPGPYLDSNTQPYGPSLLTPPPQLTAYLPVGSQVPAPVLISWIDTTTTVIEMPSVTPSIAPSTYVPPPPAQISWPVQDPPFQVGRRLTPPQSGPAPQNPPFAGGPPILDYLPALWDWLPADPQPPVARNLNPPQSAPQNPPFMGGGQIPDGLANTWIPPDPASIVARNLVPPLTVSNPPFMGGASIPDGLLNWWGPPDPLPTLPAKYVPQPAAASYLAPNRFPVPVQVAWAAEVDAGWELVLNFPAPQPPPAPFAFPAPFPQAIFTAWLPPDPGPTLDANGQPYQPRNLTPPQSGPAAQNPPFPGTKVATEVQVSWLPLAPRPITGPLLVQGAQAASPPPVRGTSVPLEVQVAWIPPPPQPTLWPPFNGALAPVSLVPVPLGGASVPDPVSVWWSIPAPPQPPVSAPLTPPSNPVPVPLKGAVVPQAVLTSWYQPPVAQPPAAINLTQAPLPTNPPFMGGAALPYPVTAWWNIPPPMYQVAVNLKSPIAGPTPQNPPLMGGSRIPLAVLIDWIPPSPQPPVAWTATQAFQPPPGVQLKTDPRFITLPQPRQMVTSQPRQRVTYSRLRMFVTVPQLQGTGMPRGNDFSLIDPSETATLTWDFAPWLAAGVTITSIVATSCSLLTGTDPAPSSRLIGVPQIGASPTSKLASQGVLQQVQGMQNNATYILLCTVNTSDSQVLTLYAHQLCQGPT